MNLFPNSSQIRCSQIRCSLFFITDSRFPIPDSRFPKKIYLTSLKTAR
ncbi:MULTISPECIES: hypothetical protein [Moorena]|nr:MULTISPECIES: hypothetical protein [Moorena]NEP32377.1 hypothetical protein [Moorena sp. SIO3B2]NEP64022.1 hypothetical protein [Moorena sp. SIO3A5]NEQ08583.1 hypothetical protein [Moorena sp. SIO4E2]NER91903.1 hypothetical protein [Moorena sp. SIO3A2]NES40945.1 hypothetical protein [Moorena sp. SIO2C4]